LTRPGFSLSVLTNLLFKRRGTGYENDNWMGLKLAKKHLHRAWHCIPLDLPIFLAACQYPWITGSLVS